MIDPELLEEVGAKPSGSEGVREIMREYYKYLKRRFVDKEDEMGKIKVRVTKTTVIHGQGMQVPRGHIYMIPEEAFEHHKGRLQGNLERLDGKGAPPEPVARDTDGSKKAVLTSGDSVSK